MYSELLGELYTGVDSDQFPATPEELTVMVLQCRNRLQRHSVERGGRVADDLAFQLDHDRFLLRLCSELGIDPDP
jgi:hypothetical protein